MGTFELTMLFLSIFVFAPLAVFIGVFIYYYFTTIRYFRFVKKHSAAYKNLKEINKKYKFTLVEKFDLIKSYNDKLVYGLASCKDYLIDQLAVIKDNVFNAISATKDNAVMYVNYKKDLDTKCRLNCYDKEPKHLNKEKLAEIENKMVDFNIQRPMLKFAIHVVLKLQSKNGRDETYKEEIFDMNKVLLALGALKVQKELKRMDGNVDKAVEKIKGSFIARAFKFNFLKRGQNKKKRKDSENIVDNVTVEENKKDEPKIIEISSGSEEKKN